jgi:hypothetical protein
MINAMALQAMSRIKPVQARREPHGVLITLAAGTLQRDCIRVAADDEEDRHDLEQPRQPLGTGLGLEQVARRQRAVHVVCGGNQPMADNDDENRYRPEKIDVAVSLCRSLRSEFACLGPDFPLLNAAHEPPYLCRSDASIPGLHRKFRYADRNSAPEMLSILSIPSL